MNTEGMIVFLKSIKFIEGEFELVDKNTDLGKMVEKYNKEYNKNIDEIIKHLQKKCKKPISCKISKSKMGDKADAC